MSRRDVLADLVGAEQKSPPRRRPADVRGCVQVGELAGGLLVLHRAQNRGERLAFLDRLQHLFDGVVAADVGSEPQAAVRFLQLVVEQGGLLTQGAGGGRSPQHGDRRAGDLVVGPRRQVLQRRQATVGSDDQERQIGRLSRRQKSRADLLVGAVGSEPLREQGDHDEGQDHHARDRHEPPVGAVPLARPEEPADEPDPGELLLPLGDGGLLVLDWQIHGQYLTRGSTSE